MPVTRWNVQILQRKLRLYGSIALGLLVCYAIVRFKVVSIPPGCDALSPSMPGMGARVVVDRFYWHDRPLRDLDIVVYRSDTHANLIGRIRGLPGDRLSQVEQRLFINSQRTAFMSGSISEGVIPAGRLLVLNENPDSTQPDGRTLGLVEIIQLRGRVVCIIPVEARY